MKKRLTSGAAGEGHPDKVADQLSDCIVDLFIENEPDTRASVEVLVTTNRVIVAGEVGGANLNRDDEFDSVETVVRECIRDIGFEQDGFNWQNIEVSNYLHRTPAYIAMGVGSDDDMGAGDSVTVYGYACDENPSLMPTSLFFANQMLRAIAEARKSGSLPEIGPDGKCQLTVEYQNDVPKRVSHLVLACQHMTEGLTSEDVKAMVLPTARAVLPHDWIDRETEIWVNPTGQFIVGGPDGDAGLTGRKVSSDSYGDAAPQGDTAFSGKDPMKLDRSGSYMARYLAKNIVASGLCKKCLVSLSYAIGVSKPILVQVEDFGTGSIAPASIAQLVSELVDLSPGGIIKHLDLKKPIYRRTSCFGHFGRTPAEDGGFSWERTDLVSELIQRPLPNRVKIREESKLPADNEVRCFLTFDQTASRAGFALVDFLQECLGTLFQYSEFGTKTERVGARSIAFTVSGHDPNLSSEIRNFTREYIRWQSEPIQEPEVADAEIAAEIVAFRRTAEQFALLAERMEKKIDSNAAALLFNENQLREMSSLISAGFSDALAHFDNNLHLLEGRLREYLGRELSEAASSIIAHLESISKDDRYSRVDVDRLKDELKALEEKKPGVILKVRDVVVSGAVGGTAGNLLTEVLQAFDYWPFQ